VPLLQFSLQECICMYALWPLIEEPPGEPRKIRIGSIRDISMIIRSDEVNKEIKIDFEPGLPINRAQGEFCVNRRK
jgi:hypothetical protein